MRPGGDGCLCQRAEQRHKYIYVVPIYIDLSIITVWCSPRKGQERRGSIWSGQPGQDHALAGLGAGVRATSEACGGDLGF